MNEFEWRRQLRELRQPAAPNRDLWPAIDAALDGAAQAATPVQALPSRQRHWLLGAGLAASLLVAGGLGWRLLQAPPGNANTPAMSNWKPADPRFAGAAIELDAARMELELAIRQAPDSAGLQRLLRRTEQQQAQLRHLADRAS
ncbi:MAG TPA: hypothetical protein VN731_06395 [Rhodanobacter sp.]|nr:hypothetical protein [Rhodanobacter sp.]